MVTFVLHGHWSWLNRSAEVKRLVARLYLGLDSQAVHIAKNIDLVQHRFYATLVPIVCLIC